MGERSEWVNGGQIERVGQWVSQCDPLLIFLQWAIYTIYITIIINLHNKGPFCGTVNEVGTSAYTEGWHPLEELRLLRCK